MANKQKISTIVINNVLAFIRPFTSKTLQRAIEILLKPCCHLIVKSKTISCDGNILTITVEFENDISFYTSQQGTIFIWLPSLNIYVAAKEYGGLNPNTIIFKFENPVGGGVYDVSIDLFMPTSSDGLVGVSLSTETESWTIQPCPVISDVRLKENIELIGKSPNGLNIYNFNYIGKEGLYQGVMAQDLLGTAYELAVIPGETYKVDYSKLDVIFKKLK